jgi:hypothetical protein
MCVRARACACVRVCVCVCVCVSVVFQLIRGRTTNTFAQATIAQKMYIRNLFPFNLFNEFDMLYNNGVLWVFS